VLKTILEEKKHKKIHSNDLLLDINSIPSDLSNVAQHVTRTSSDLSTYLKMLKPISYKSKTIHLLQVKK